MIWIIFRNIFWSLFLERQGGKKFQRLIEQACKHGRSIRMTQGLTPISSAHCKSGWLTRPFPSSISPSILSKFWTKKSREIRKKFVQNSLNVYDKRFVFDPELKIFGKFISTWEYDDKSSMYSSLNIFQFNSWQIARLNGEIAGPN